MCAALFAQSQARLAGVVSDATGAVVSNVNITVQDEKTGVDRKAQSDDRGAYVVTNLNPSNYTVVAEAPGFATARYNALNLAVGQERILNITLQPATVSESITVESGELSLMETATASIGANVNSREVAALPLNGRQLSQLYLLTPGAQTAGGGSFDNIRFSGRANQQNAIRYDGVEGSSIVDASPGNLNGEVSTGFRLQSSLETVAEFRVESSNYPAELGTGSAGQISVVTKSGGNDFHGSLFEYLRNDTKRLDGQFTSEFGRNFKLSLGGQYNQGLNPIQNNNNGELRVVRNIRTLSGTSASLQYGLGGRFSLVGSVENNKQTFSEPAYRTLNLDQQARAARVLYNVTDTLQWGVGLRRVETDYPYRNNEQVRDNNIDFQVGWQATGQSSLDAVLSRRDSRYSITGRKLNSWVGSLNWEFTPRGLIVYRVGLSRSTGSDRYTQRQSFLGSGFDANFDYNTITTGVNMSARYQPTAKIGLTAAYNRGRLDDLLMRLMDTSLAFPQLLMALVALTTLGPRQWLIVLIVGFTTTPRIARITRGAAVPVVERDFIAAAEALGESRWRILWSELLPNVSGPLLVEANLRLTYSIGLIASLGFLGFATKVNAADWGMMVNENRAALVTQPWGTVLPALAIALLTVGTGLIADGLSRATAGIDRAKGDQ